MSKTYFLIIILFLLGVSYFIYKKMARKNFKEGVKPAENVKNPSASNVSMSDFPPELIKLLEDESKAKVDFLYVQRWIPEESERSEAGSSSLRKVKERGISVRSMAEEKAKNIYRNLYATLKAKNYQIFLTNMDFDNQNPPVNGSRAVYDVAVMKANDAYEVIKFINTNGQNYNEITNDVIIKKLRDWEKLVDFRIMVVNFDRIEAEILRLPPDVNKFAKEIYEFAPDTVDQGAGSLEELAKYIAKERSFWLWWD